VLTYAMFHDIGRKFLEYARSWHPQPEELLPAPGAQANQCFLYCGCADKNSVIRRAGESYRVGTLSGVSVKGDWPSGHSI